MRIAGDLTRPVTRLFELVLGPPSDWLRGKARASTIRSIADADAYKKQCEASTEMEIEQMRLEHAMVQRARIREESDLLRCESNIEDVLLKAAPQILPDAEPDKIDSDFLAAFTRSAELCSDEQMQGLWARILAGEANTPGRFSKRTIRCVSEIDRRDAEMFTRLCRLTITIGDGRRIPVVWDVKRAQFLKDVELKGSDLLHLENIGFISFSMSERFAVMMTSHIVQYFDTSVSIPNIPVGRTFALTHCLFTVLGTELEKLCECSPLPKFSTFLLGIGSR